jgi:O-antigen/teichoic acid export membrane protein
LAHNRDLIVISGGRLAFALISLISIRAVTTFLTPEQYGELAILITVQMFFGLFFVNPVGQHINLHTHAWWDDGTLLARLKSYRNYVLAVSLVGAIVVLGMGKQNSVEQLLWTAIAMFAMVSAGTWNATLIPMLNMLGFRVTSVLWSIITVVTGLVCSIILAMWLPSAAAWFAGQAIGMGLGALGAGYFIQRNGIRSHHSLIKLPLLDKRTILTYCFPLAVATGFMWLQLSGYRFLIENYWGLASLGFLVVGLQLASQIFSLAESLAMQFLHPLFYRRVSDHENIEEVESAFSDLLNTLVPVYFVIAGVLILSTPYLLKVLIAPKFQGAITFVMLGAGIELCRVLGNLLSNAAHVRRKTKTLTLPYFTGSMTALAFIYFAGEWKLEVNWTGAALLVGAIAMLVVMWLSMRQQVILTFDFWRWVSGAAVMCVMAIFSIWMPSVSGLSGAIGMLILTGALAVIAMGALMWNNPAMRRLVNVKLRKN